MITVKGTYTVKVTKAHISKHAFPIPFKRKKEYMNAYECPQELASSENNIGIENS
jgi:hypothetical protein